MRNFGVGQLNRCGAIIALLINKVLVPQEKAPSPVKSRVTYLITVTHAR